MLRSARKMGLAAARLGREEATQYEQSGVRFARRQGTKISHRRLVYSAWVTDEALVALNDDPNVVFMRAAGLLHAVPTADISVPEIQADIRPRR